MTIILDIMGVSTDLVILRFITFIDYKQVPEIAKGKDNIKNVTVNISGFRIMSY